MTLRSDARRCEIRSLALHAAVREKLEQDPEVLKKALENCALWEEHSPHFLFWARQWRTLLLGPRATLLHLLTDTSEQAARLRQASPFAGVLSTKERRAIFEHHKMSF